VPLSSLSIDELHSKAADLRKMAQTARTVDTNAALLRLAARYVQLAEERMAGSDSAGRRISSWQLQRAAPRDGTEAFTD
jgi:hypothetical protein